MTKKDYVLLAGLLRAACAPTQLIAVLADGMERENALFQRDRFIAAATPDTVHHASLCPNCGGDNLDGAHFDSDGDTVTQEVGCNDCGAEWMDVYQLESFTYIHQPEATA